MGHSGQEVAAVEAAGKVNAHQLPIVVSFVN